MLDWTEAPIGLNPIVHVDMYLEHMTLRCGPQEAWAGSPLWPWHLVHIYSVSSRSSWCLFFFNRFPTFLASPAPWSFYSNLDFNYIA